MSWPLSQDYNEAIQDPRSSFADAELRDGQPTTNALGLPLPRSGNFADVYEFHCPKHKTRWALKCFTRKVTGLRERYSEISRYLQDAKLPFTVAFQYLEQGIRIRGQWYPLLKMRWVEGYLLNEFVRDNLDKPALIQSLGLIWQRMAKRLREARIAHADLQHGNVLLVPGATSQSLGVRLIDYDGMFVPALAGKKSGEVGHPNYQHPQRLREGTYNGEVDRVPLLVVATALRALSVGGRELWERHDNGDNLLFRESDLRAPAESELFRELKEMPDPLVKKLAGRLAEACERRLEDAPLLEELLPEDRPAVKVAARPASAFMATPPVEEVEHLPNWDFGESEDEPPRTRSKRRKTRRKRSKVPMWGWVAAAAAVLLVTGIGVTFATRGGRAKPSGPVVVENRTNTLPKEPEKKTEKQASQTQQQQGPPKQEESPRPRPPAGPPSRLSSEKPLTAVHAVALARDGTIAAAGCTSGEIVLWDVKAGRELRRFAGHQKPVHQIALSPDGKRLFSASSDKTVRAWEVDSGKPLWTHTSDMDGVQLAASPEGRYVASTSTRAVHLLDAGTGQEVRRAELAHAYSLAFSPDSTLLAAGLAIGFNKRNSIHLLKVTDGREVAVCEGHKNYTTALAFSPDGRRLLSAGYDGRVRLWDAKTGAEAAQLAGDRLMARAVAFAPAGTWVVAAGGAVLCWDARTNEPLLGPRSACPALPADMRVQGLALASDGRSVLLGGESGTGTAREGFIGLYDTREVAPAVAPAPAETPKPAAVVRGQLRRLEGRVANARSLAFSPDGRLLAVGHETGALRLWDVKAGKELHSFEGLGGRVTSIAFSADGATVSANANIQGVRTWEVESKRPVGKLLPGYEVSPKAYFRASVELVKPRYQPTLRLWQKRFTREYVRFPVNDNTNVSVSFSGDGWRVAFLGRRGVLYVFDLLKRTQVARFNVQVNRSAQAACIAPDGKSVLVSYPGGELRLWDLATQKPGQPFTAHAGLVRALDFSPDGKLAFSGDNRGAVHVWEAATGKHLAEFTGATRRIEQLAASPDGRQLGAVTPEGVFLWELGDLAGPAPPGTAPDTPKPAGNPSEAVAVLPHKRWVSSIAVSADSRQLLSADTTATLTLWDLKTRTKKRSFPGISIFGRRMAFLPRGRQMLCAPRDNVLQVVSLDTGQVVRRLGPVPNSARFVRVSADGRLALVAGTQNELKAPRFVPRDYDVYLWDIKAAKRLGVWEGHTRAVLDARFSADGRRVVSLGEDGIRVWELPRGKPVKFIPLPIGHASVLSADGRLAALGGGDKSPVRIWDVEAAAELKRLPGRKGQLNCMAFSARGDRLLSSGWAFLSAAPPGVKFKGDPEVCVVRLWDVKTGQELCRFKGHTHIVADVAFTPDGRLAISACHDETVRLWDLAGLPRP